MDGLKTELQSAVFSAATVEILNQCLTRSLSENQRVFDWLDPGFATIVFFL